MITTGLIKNINISSSNYTNNKYSVELNIFQIPGDRNKDNYTSLANCCACPGLYDSYKVGDRVYVGFINNDTSHPVILGKIYQGISSESRSAICLETLTAAKKAQLPKDTIIGDITYNQLLNLFNKNERRYYMHNITAILNSGDICKFQILTRSKEFPKDKDTGEILIDTVANEFYLENSTFEIVVNVYKQDMSETYFGRLSYKDESKKLSVAYNNMTSLVSSIQSDNVREL